MSGPLGRAWERAVDPAEKLAIALDQLSACRSAWARDLLKLVGADRRLAEIEAIADDYADGADDAHPAARAMTRVHEIAGRTG